MPQVSAPVPNIPLNNFSECQQLMQNPRELDDDMSNVPAHHIVFNGQVPNAAVLLHVKDSSYHLILQGLLKPPSDPFNGNPEYTTPG